MPKLTEIKPINVLIQEMEDSYYYLGVTEQNTLINNYPKEEIGYLFIDLAKKCNKLKDDEKDSPVSYFENLKRVSAFIIKGLAWQMLPKQFGFAGYLIAIPVTLAGILAAPIAGLLWTGINLSFRRTDEKEIAELKDKIRTKATEAGYALDAPKESVEKDTSQKLSSLGTKAVKPAEAELATSKQPPKLDKTLTQTTPKTSEPPSGSKQNALDAAAAPAAYGQPPVSGRGSP